jgi:hypothetical protein
MKIPAFPTPCEVSPEEQEHWRKHFAGIEAEKWDHQTWDTVIVDPALILKHLERASSEPHPSPWLSQPESDFVLGPGPTPRGLRYSMVVLLNLRDEGKVTSWLPAGPQGPAKNAPSTTTEWWFGECEWDLGGRGILNGEPHE